VRIACLLVACCVIVSCGGKEGSPGAGSVLHRGLNTDPESLDPHKARSVQAGEVLRDIGEGLLGYTAGGELVPGAPNHGRFQTTA